MTMEEMGWVSAGGDQGLGLWCAEGSGEHSQNHVVGGPLTMLEPTLLYQRFHQSWDGRGVGLCGISPLPKYTCWGSEETGEAGHRNAKQYDSVNWSLSTIIRVELIEQRPQEKGCVFYIAWSLKKTNREVPCLQSPCCLPKRSKIAAVLREFSIASWK